MSVYYTHLLKAFESFRFRHDIHKVFEDFLELAACSISNSTNTLRWQEREAWYLKNVARYTEKEAKQFGDMLGMLVLALEDKPDDYLGRAFMELELFNTWRGQFFTPFDVAYLMANMSLRGDIEQQLRSGRVIRINDCAVGGGVTLIAAFTLIKELGYNPQQVARFYAADIDRKGVFMTYIQLSLLGAHATVWHMDTLTLEHWDTWLSPPVFLGGGLGLGAPQPMIIPAAEPTPESIAASGEQLSLF